MNGFEARAAHVVSRSTVPPPHPFFNEIAGFETSSRPYLMEYGGHLLPRRHRSIALCSQENIAIYLFHSILPRVEHP